MARKANKSKSVAHKTQKADLARKQALKERLKKRQKRRPVAASFLGEAYELYDDGMYEDVCDLIEEQLTLHPQIESIGAWELLGNSAIQLQDSPTIARAYRRLCELMPDEIHFQVNYAAALLKLALPLLSQRAFERLIERWPNDPLSAGAPETLRDVREGVQETYGKFPWSEQERDELALLHEEMLYGLATNSFQHTIKFGEALLSQAPTFPPAFNNLALAYRETGQVAKAVALCEELLASEPFNPHALVILGDCLYAEGKRQQARETWSRLQTLEIQYRHRGDFAVRQMEALARLGEHAEVLQVLETAEQQDLFRSHDPMYAVAYHLAGVAAARLGQHRMASQHWTQALEINPNYHLAADNREDHEQPPGEQNGPWIQDRLPWLTKNVLLELSKMPAASANSRQSSQKDEQSSTFQMRAGVQWLMKHYPELPELVSDALRGGSPESRQMAIMICEGSESAEFHNRLREFAFSPHGSDQVRLSAASWLREHGLLTESNLKFWSKGEQTEVKMLCANITREGKNSLPEEVQDLHREAHETLRAGEFVRSEKLYRQCLAIAGEDPSLLFNLSSAIEQQRGRAAEAQALRDDIIRRWPDYFFGKIELVQRAIKRGDYELAREGLADLSKLEEYHVSEFVMLCFCHVELEIRAGRPESARSWIDQVRQIDPDNPNLEMFDRELNPANFNLRSSFKKLLGRH